MIVYAFDCDETLECSGGPVTFDSIFALKAERNIVGICGNWARAFDACAASWLLWSFFGPVGCTKVLYLMEIKKWIQAVDFVFVGNDHSKREHWSPDDAVIAKQADWRFIDETAFAAGAR